MSFRRRGRRTGSSPCFLITAADSGVCRKRISAFAASACAEPDGIPAAKVVMFCKSPGSGPTTSAPSTCISSGHLLDRDVGLAR